MESMLWRVAGHRSAAMVGDSGAGSALWRSLRLNMQGLTGTVIISLTLLLSACGSGNGGGRGNDSGDGEETPSNLTYSSQPITLVLRSGESDIVESTADGEPTTSLKTARTTDPTGLMVTAPKACDNPSAFCESRTFTAPVAPVPEPHSIEYFRFGQDVFGTPSYIPIVQFDAAPQTAPPVIGLSLYGDDAGRYNLDLNRGRSMALALDSSGNLWSWGEYVYVISDGEGDGSPDIDYSHAMPHPYPLLTNVAEISAGGYYSLAILDDGSVWQWRNIIDTGRPVVFDTPQQVPGISNAIAVAAGFDSRGIGYALRSDGTVWTWTSNDSGIDPANVSQVTGVDGAVAIAQGEAHALALRSDGSVWSWGSNLYNQLGNVTIDGSNDRVAHRVMGLGSVTAIAAGGRFSLTLAPDGDVYGWGADDYGQIGGTGSDTCDGDTPCSAGPNRIIGTGVAREIAAGYSFAVARRNDGSVWAWGDNRRGQLGGLPGLQSTVPLQINGIANAIAIRAGGATGMAISADDSCLVDGQQAGRIMAWGDNETGMRGDGTATNWLAPTPVLTLGDGSQCAGLLGYRLIVYKSGTGSGSVSSDAPGLSCTGQICWQDIAAGSDVTLTASPALGSAFAEWRWDCTTSALATTVTLNQVRHCKVIFNRTEDNVFTLQVATVLDNGGVRSSNIGGTVSSSPNGISCPADCSEPFNGGTAVTLTASADAGYQFSHWEGSACSSGTVAMDSDVSCTAVFVPDGPTPSSGLIIAVSGEQGGVITPDTGGFVTTSPAGITCPGDCTEAFAPGTVVTLNATPDSGYVLQAWEGGGTCSDGLVRIPTAVIQCTARFAVLPSGPGGSTATLTVNISGGPGAGEVTSNDGPPPAMDCINSSTATTTCTAQFAIGSAVQLQASAFGSKTLSIGSWRGCTVVDASHCDVNMDQDRTVNVQFGN